jgi:hypothetical protein
MRADAGQVRAFVKRSNSINSYTKESRNCAKQNTDKGERKEDRDRCKNGNNNDAINHTQKIIARVF